MHVCVYLYIYVHRYVVHVYHRRIAGPSDVEMFAVCRYVVHVYIHVYY